MEKAARVSCGESGPNGTWKRRGWTAISERSNLAFVVMTRLDVAQYDCGHYGVQLQVLKIKGRFSSLSVTVFFKPVFFLFSFSLSCLSVFCTSIISQSFIC